MDVFSFPPEFHWVNVKNQAYRSYVLSTVIKLEFVLHEETGGGKVKDLLKTAVEDVAGGVLNVAVDKVVEVICRGGFLSGPKLMTFQSKEEEEAGDGAKK